MSAVLAAFAAAALAQTASAQTADAVLTADADRASYGVFVGLEPENAGAAAGYETIVVDAALFSAEQIADLHRSARTVYSYLNIGSIEKFRSYYADFKKITLGPYRNWPEERWIDVSNPAWQNFITETLAQNLVEKGIDGFFLDNADVWHEYREPRIYAGLLQILAELKRFGLPVILNGADTFVRHALDTGELAGLVDGVNQETVFTTINFKKGTFGTAKTDAIDYYTDYLLRCKRAGLAVYLTEYGTDARTAERIAEFCIRNGFAYYVSPSVQLNGAPPQAE